MSVNEVPCPQGEEDALDREDVAAATKASVTDRVGHQASHSQGRGEEGKTLAQATADVTFPTPVPVVITCTTVFEAAIRTQRFVIAIIKIPVIRCVPIRVILAF